MQIGHDHKQSHNRASSRDHNGAEQDGEKSVFAGEVTFGKGKARNGTKEQHQHSRYAGNEERIKKTGEEIHIQQGVIYVCPQMRPEKQLWRLMIDIAGCVGGHSDHPVEGENCNHKPDDKQGMRNDFPGPGFLNVHASRSFYLSLTYYTPVDNREKQDDEEHDPTDG